MKEAFLKCMKYLYPRGITDKVQHRDLIRTFAMGWAEALGSAEAWDHQETWLEEYVFLKDLNWWPDDSWKWW